MPNWFMPQGSAPDEAVRQIQQAADEAEALDIEAGLLEQSDNRPHEGDPKQPEEVA